jgi:outer membrane protein assembly factor BamB
VRETHRRLPFVVRFTLPTWCLTTVAALLCWRAASAQVLLKQPLIARPAIAQADAATAADSEKEDRDNVFVLPDRTVVQRLTQAKQLLADGAYSQAIELLDRILKSPQDSFFQPDKDMPAVHRSLKGEAQRLIGDMPRKGREEYLRKFEREARNLLTQAKAAGDPTALGDVSRRYFHTAAGYEATFLLGLHHFDHGRPLAAALTLQRLRDAAHDIEALEPQLSLILATAWLQVSGSDRSVVEKSRELLAEVKQRYGKYPLRVGGRQVRWFDREADALPWLTALVGAPSAQNAAEADRWGMFRGAPARNALTSGSPPLLNLRWEIPVSDPDVEKLLRQTRQIRTDQDSLLLPSLHPLVVDDMVLLRTARNLLAVDFASGVRKWEIPVDDTLESLLGEATPEMLQRNWMQWGAGLGQRMWEDATYGTLSCDGRCVYSIEDLGLGVVTPNTSRAIVVGAQRVGNQNNGPYNRLAAHDIRTGKLKWSIGGPSDQFALPHADTFFLGPPLPLMGQLYVLAESRKEGAIVLMALDGDPNRRGAAIWPQPQPLAVIDPENGQDPNRRLSGASPSYADGILVCPTAAGAVVAVDLATRSLLWGYNYGRNDPSGRNVNNAVMMMRINGVYTNNVPSQRRWADSIATIVDGKVLVTPSDSDALHCLNLSDGKLLWTSERKAADHDDLYVGCVRDDKVVLVGRHEVRALSLRETFSETKKIEFQERTRNGIEMKNKEVTFVRPKQLWSVALPEGSAPSGRGFFGGKEYFVPLSSAEVVAVDLQNGRIVRRARSRNGDVPGNLVCYKGYVISQGFERIEKYFQADAARSEADRVLAAEPKNAEALTLRGEILMDEGKQVEAIACFRQAYEADRKPRTRALLREALLDGLRTQFAATRQRAEEIEQLLDDDAQRASYLRLMAAGLMDAREWLPAFRHIERLIELPQTDRQPEAVSPTHSVRRDRWVQSQLAAMRSSGKDSAALAEIDAVLAKDSAALTEIDAAIAARCRRAVASGEIRPLREFLDYFGNQPPAAEARRALIGRLVAAEHFLDAEMLLWSEQQAADPQVAGPAVAELAELLRKANRPEDAAVCYRRLAQEFAGVPCRDGKTGKQLAAGLAEDDAARRAMTVSAEWPTGLVEKKTTTVRGARAVNYGRFVVKYDGDPGPFLGETVIQYDQNRRTITAHDGWGKERWNLPLAEPGQNIYINRATAETSVHGHLLLLSLGQKLVAIDTLGNGGARAPQRLWEQDLSGSTFDPNGNAIFLANGMMINGGIVNSYGRTTNRLGVAGPATSRYVSFQRFRHLSTIDSLTGELLWTNHNVPPGSELFGDDERVFALPPDQTEALVFRALDGQFLGKRAIPRVAPEQNVAIRYQNPNLKYLPLSQTCAAFVRGNLLLWYKDPASNQRLLRLYDPWQQKDVWPEGARKFHAQAVADDWRGEVVAVWEPDGHIAMFSLPDGRPMADAQLKTGTPPAPANFNSGIQPSLLVLKYLDRYLLVHHSPDPNNPNPKNAQPLPGTVLQQPMYRGWVYAFDKHGKVVWPEPVFIEGQHLPADQPSLLPVLTFACQQYLRPAGSGGTRYQMSVLCIDKRTGQKFDPLAGLDGNAAAQPVNTLGALELAGDPQEHSLEMRMPQSTVVLTFTDKTAPAAPAPAEKPKARVKPADALRNIFRKNIEGIPAPPIRLLPDLEEEIDPFSQIVPLFGDMTS